MAAKSNFVVIIGISSLNVILRLTVIVMIGSRNVQTLAGLSKGYLIPIQFWRLLEMLRLQETKTAVGLENIFNFSLIGESAQPED